MVLSYCSQITVYRIHITDNARSQPNEMGYKPGELAPSPLAISSIISQSTIVTTINKIHQ